MSKTIRSFATFLAFAVMLTSMLAFFGMPNVVVAEELSGAWKEGAEGTTFVIGGTEYAVSADASYSQKVITYKEVTYYLITDAADLNTLVNGTEVSTIGIHAILTDNITLQDRTSAQNCYGLELEGNGKTITFSGSCTDGVFNNFSGIVRNLNLEGSISRTNHCAPLIYWAKGGTELINVTSSVNVTVTLDSSSNNAYVGGLVACVQSATALGGLSDSNYYGIFTDCVVTGTLSIANPGGYVGGIVGGLQYASKFDNCDFTGEIVDVTTSNTSSNGGRGLGGMVGTINNKATNVVFLNCENGDGTDEDSGKITSKYKAVGGMIGYTKGTTITITACINRGSLTNNSTVNTGGMIGQADGTTINLTNCQNLGTLRGSGSSTGSMIGYCGATANLSGCVNSVDISTGAGSIGGMVGKSNGALTITNCQNNGDITNSGSSSGIENVSAGGIIGCLRNNKTHTISGTVNNGDVSCANASGYAGGILGSVSNAGTTITITDSANNGAVSSTGALPSSIQDSCGGAVGGLIAGTYKQNDSNGTVSFTINGSMNNGTVTAGSDVLNQAGGLIGFVGHGSTMTVSIADSANRANVISSSETGYVAGIVGDVIEGVSLTVSRSFSCGTLTGTNVYALAYFVDSPSASGVYVNSNANAGMNTDEVTLKSAAAFAAGEVAYLLNTAAGSTVWYQTIGSDTSPINDDTAETVYQVNLKVGDTTVGKTYSNTNADTAFTLTTTASYRSDDPTGIRWITTMDDYQAEVLVASGLNYTVSTLISPKKYVDAAGGLTKAQLTSWLTTLGESDFALAAFDLTATDWYGSVTGQFAGSLVNVKSDNLSLQFSGAGYLAIGEDIVYASPVAAVYSTLAGN